MTDAEKFKFFTTIRNDANYLRQKYKFRKNHVDPGKFNLDEIPATLVSQANTILKGAFPIDVLYLVESQNMMSFVFDNAAQFLACEIYEEALFEAYVSAKINLHNWRFDILKALFELADRKKLFLCGDSITHNPPVTVYRGVSGEGDAYRPRGFSWTGDFEKAKWFALFPEDKYGIVLPNCRVFKTSITKENIYFYTNSRDEDEFVSDIDSGHSLEVCWERS